MYITLFNLFVISGQPIPRRMLPSEDVILYYSSPENRGYLADPDKISYERLVLSQKFGYELPSLSKSDPMFEVLMERKDPRQIFYGLEPGWIINVVEKEIYKPKDKELIEYYRT